MNSIFTEVLAAIGESAKIAVTSHDRPDGDAIGSVVALGLMLEAEGKEVIMLNNDGIPDAISFLPGSDKVHVVEREDSFSADLILALDSAGPDRISEKVWSSLPGDCRVINIDHHVSNSNYGDINVVNSESPATGEIIYELATFAGWTITREVAENLFAAISTDTGSFRYPNTTANTYRAAAALIEAGVDLGQINQQLYESYPIRRVECIRDLLQEMRLYFDDRCATVRLTREVKNRLGLGPGDTEGVIDIIRAIDTVIVAVFFEEMNGGKIRISSRSKSLDANVGDICALFGGGGHHLAAGARMDGTIEDAEKRFVEAVGEVLNK